MAHWSSSRSKTHHTDIVGWLSCVPRRLWGGPRDCGPGTGTAGPGSPVGSPPAPCGMRSPSAAADVIKAGSNLLALLHLIHEEERPVQRLPAASLRRAAKCAFSAPPTNCSTRAHLVLRRRSSVGSSPVSSWYSTMPRDQMSEAGVGGRPWTTSGACGSQSDSALLDAICFRQWRPPHTYHSPAAQNGSHP